MTGDVQLGPVVLLIHALESGHPRLAQALEVEGYTIWHVTTGADARKMLAGARRAGLEPDAIVLDQVLPDVDGRVLSAFLRAVVDAPIVLCAPGTEPAGRAVGYHAGIDGFLQSPIDVHELHPLLQALLRRAGVKPRLVNASSAGPENEALTVGSLVIHGQNARYPSIRSHWR